MRWTGRLRRDQRGSIHVIEALLAGMIILTAVLFMTNVSKPSPPAAESGIDLEGVARDLLVVMENRPAADNACPAAPPVPPPGCYPSRLEEIVGHALGYDVADETARDQSNQEAEEFLRQVVPVGNRWLLRLDNGVEPLVLLPASGSNVQLTPRAAKAAETFIVPSWQAWSGDCGAAPSPASLSPSEPEGLFDASAGATLHAPTGSLWPAGSTSWADWWQQQQEAADDPAHERIPPTAMYGWWWLDSNGDDAVDAPGECHFIGLPDGSATEHPAYGVQLVVWPIAG